MSSDTQSHPDGWTRLGNAIGHLLGVLLRLLFVILLAVGVGAGVYYGVPYLYAQLVQPVQTNTYQIALLNAKVDGQKTSLDASQAAQDTRLTDLETKSDNQKQRLDSTSTDITGLKTSLSSEQSARSDLAGQVAGLKAQLEAQTSASSQLSSDVAALKPAASDATAQVAKLQQQVTLLRLQNSLLTAHIQEVAQNLGDARTILTTTVSAMQSFVKTPGVFSADDQAALNVRLVTAGALIDADPVAALADMESIWAQMDRTLNGSTPAQ
jgi:hypothetical protein